MAQESSQLTLTTKTTAGKDAGSVTLDAAVFGLEPNVPLMHQVVTAQLAARRSGTQSTKTRAEVRGGGRKPYAQKGTGNARQGSIRAPHFTGGGVALGPKPRVYSQKTPKKMIKLAMRSALSDRASEGKVLVVDSWNFDAPKTKVAKQALDALSVDGNVLVVIAHDDTNALLSFRNLPNVQVMDVGELNAYDVLCSDWVVFTEAALPTGADAVHAAPKTKAVTAPATKTADAAPKKKATAPEPDAADAKPATLISDTATASDADDASDAGDTATASDAVDAPYGDGSHAPIADDAQPDGFPIKGNADSMLFHVPDSRFYNNTVAEVWFATEEAAVAAGFSKPASQQKADEAAADEAEAADSEQEGEDA
jgi:large subunit ribosomal protein L4